MVALGRRKRLPDSRNTPSRVSGCRAALHDRIAHSWKCTWRWNLSSYSVASRAVCRSCNDSFCRLGSNSLLRISHAVFDLSRFSLALPAEPLSPKRYFLFLDHAKNKRLLFFQNRRLSVACGVRVKLKVRQLRKGVKILDAQAVPLERAVGVRLWFLFSNQHGPVFFLVSGSS